MDVDVYGDVGCHAMVLFFDEKEERRVQTFTVRVRGDMVGDEVLQGRRT